VGVNDKFMKELATDDIQPGEAILFVLVKKVTGDKVLDGLKGVGGRILQTSLDHEKEQKLRDALAGHANFGHLPTRRLPLAFRRRVPKTRRQVGPRSGFEQKGT